MFVTYPRAGFLSAKSWCRSGEEGHHTVSRAVSTGNGTRSGDHRSQDTAQSDAQFLPIIVVGPTDSDHLPACISEILVAHDPVTFCLFEFIARLTKFRDSVELNDDVEILDQEVDIVVIPVNTDVDLRVNCEGTDRTNDP